MSLSKHLISTYSATDSKCPAFEEGSCDPCNEMAEIGFYLSEHSTAADAVTHCECPELEESHCDPSDRMPETSSETPSSTV